MASKPISVEIPPNVLVDHVSPAGTISNCRDMLAFLTDTRQDDDAISNRAPMGLFFVLKTLDGALQYVEAALDEQRGSEKEAAQ